MKLTTNSIIALFILAGILIFALPFVFGLSTGNTIRIIGASFFGLLACVIIYFAFAKQLDFNKELVNQNKELMNHNKLVAGQFEQQMLDQNFFKLIDAMNQRMNNYAFEDQHTNEKNGNEIVKLIAQDLLNEMMLGTLLNGRLLIADKPDLLNKLHYEHLLVTSKDYVIDHKEHIDQAKAFKTNLINLSETNQHWEYLKTFLGTNRSDNKQKAQNLRVLASVYFYKSSFEVREKIYEKAFDSLKMKHGNFIEGYLEILNQTLLLVEKLDNTEFYVAFLKSQLSSFEKMLVFYYIAANEANENFKKAVDQYNLVDDLHEFTDYLINLPSKTEFREELEEILKADAHKST